MYNHLHSKANRKMYNDMCFLGFHLHLLHLYLFINFSSMSKIYRIVSMSKISLLKLQRPSTPIRIIFLTGLSLFHFLLNHPYFSKISWIISYPRILVSPTFGQHKGVIHFLTYKASYDVILMLEW